MKIRYVQGDLIAGEQVLIVHGCNARGRMNSGLALSIRQQLPFAYDAYRAAFDDRTVMFGLGEVIWGFDIHPPRRPRIVGNLITQDEYGRDPDRVYVSYDAVKEAVRRVNVFARQTQDGTIKFDGIGAIENVGFPLIGCGLANGSWKTVSAIIEAESECFEPVVYTLDGVIPG